MAAQDPPTAKTGTPFFAVDKTETFAESDVSITHNHTKTSGGAIQFAEDMFSQQIDRPADDGQDGPFASNENRGVVAVPQENGTGFRVTVSANCSALGIIKIFEGTSSPNRVGYIDGGVTPGETYDFKPAGGVSAGTEYCIVVSGSSDWLAGYYSAPNFPYSQPKIDVTKSARDVKGYQPGFGTSKFFTLDKISLIQSPTDGNATIAWTPPEEISRWDSATFGRILDGETVSIDIEDGSGNVIASDIQKNHELAGIDANTNIAVRVNFFRADTANNPTLKMTARRYVI